MRKTRPFIPLPAGMTPGIPELDPLLRPAQIYGRPAAVVGDPSLSLAEKRAILSSWASDACAVESMPTLRRPPGLGSAVPFEEIMEALRALDTAGREHGGAITGRGGEALRPV